MSGVTINGILFSDENIPLMEQEIANLPPPDIIPRETVVIKDTQVGLCLQRETISLDELNLANTIDYIGTKDVYTCIFAYIRSRTDHLGIHFDYNKNRNLVELLSRFNDKTNIEVTLVGGIPSKNDHEESLSIKNLHKLLHALFKAAKILDITISITSQFILDRNVFSNSDKPEYIFDEIIERADILSRQFFKKPLDPLAYQDRRLKDFEERESPTLQHNAKFAMLIAMAADVYDLSIKNLVDKLMIESKFKIKSEEDFIKHVDGLFSKEGFQKLDSYLESMKKYRVSKLAHFAFNIRDRKLYVISSMTKTPHQITRNLYTINSENKHKYFHCYDGKTMTHHIPHISDKLLSAYDQFHSKIRCNFFVNRIKVAHLLDVPESDAVLTPIEQFYMRYHEEKELGETPVSTFFHINETPDEFYLQDVTVTQNLILLNNVTNREFQAKMRKYPEHIVDGLLFCESNNEAMSFKEMLKAYNIESNIIQFRDSYCLCVQAINVDNYSIPMVENINCLLLTQKP